MDRFSLTSAPATNFRRQREGGEGRRSKCRLSLSSSAIIVPFSSLPSRTLSSHPFRITFLYFLFHQFHSIFLFTHFLPLYSFQSTLFSHHPFLTLSPHLFSSSPFKSSCLPVLPRTKTSSSTTTTTTHRKRGRRAEGGKEGVGKRG